jgi:hypothetical protein
VTKYIVRICAIIEKDVEVEASSTNEAIEIAHGAFDFEAEENEYYDQQLVHIKEEK